MTLVAFATWFLYVAHMLIPLEKFYFSKVKKTICTCCEKFLGFIHTV